jgi:hypothetical protein
MNLLQDIESILVGAWDAIKSFFSSLSKEEQELVPTAEAFIEKLQSELNNPEAVTIESLIPDNIGTTAASIANTILAGILAGLTYLDGLVTATGAPATGAENETLANPDAVAKAALTKVATASPAQQQVLLNSYGNLVMSKLAPAGSNITVATANTARVAYKVSNSSAS